MKSRSSRPKNDSSVNREAASKLLEDGRTILNPGAELLTAAAHVSGLGLLDLEIREFVRCANPRDRDYPPRNRHCHGWVYVEDPQGTSFTERHCPECDRRIFLDGKHHFTELRTCLLPRGVMAFLTSTLVGLKANVRESDTGVLHVEIGETGIDLCVVDFAREKYLARERALQRPTFFVAVNPRDFEDRFLEEAWVQRTALAEVLSGTVDLCERIRQMASSGAPHQIRHVSVPVCGTGPLAVIAEPRPRPEPRRRFVVEVGDNLVRVNGLKVLSEQAGPRFTMIRLLWEQFLEDVKRPKPLDDFRAIPLRDIIEALKKAGQGVSDETSVRRTINRLQADIEQRIKKELGLPIDREDIIETCQWSGAHSSNFGYRLNPHSVITSPFQDDLS